MVALISSAVSSELMARVVLGNQLGGVLPNDVGAEDLLVFLAQEAP